MKASNEKVKSFQIRWAEPLGKPNCPYMVRWVLILFGYSIRIHHWIRSDDKRYFHDHPWNFLTIVLKGGYDDVSPIYYPLQDNIKLNKNQFGTLLCDKKNNGNVIGIKLHETLSFGNFKFRKAEHKHYVDVPKNGCWTLLFCGKQIRKWGFWIKVNQFFRPLRYFSKYGHPPCSDQ